MTKDKQNPIQRLLSKRGMGQVLTVTVGLIILVIMFGIINPNFFKPKNITNLLRQIAPILIIGVGQSFVLITGNIDLSVGSVIGMSSMVSATLMAGGMNPWLAAFVAMLASLLLGFVNGVLVAKWSLPPFIATLGTMTIGRGIAQIVNNNLNTGSIGKAASGFKDFFYYGSIGGIYYPILIALVLFLVFNLVLSKTRTGRHTYAVGSNVEAAALSGVNVFKTVTKVYLISAFCAGLAGLITTAQAGMGAMDAGNGYEMYSVAASVIGGVSTLGGQGILIGTVVGAAIWSVLQNGLQFAGAPVAIRNIVIGVIVVVSVLLDIIVRSGRSLKKKS